MYTSFHNGGSNAMSKGIAKKILEKMLRYEHIGGRHTAFENLSKGFPKHLVGEVKKTAKELIKMGLITPKMTSYGLQVSLNPRKMEQIEEIMRDP
jgi:hypothetical protein